MGKARGISVAAKDAATGLASRITAVIGEAADPAAVEAWADTLPEAFLECRKWGHSWRPWRAYWDAEARGYQEIARCSRCKTERTQLLSDTGSYLHKPSYKYPEAYPTPAGTGRLDAGARDAIRLVAVLRLVEKVDARASKRAS